MHSIARGASKDERPRCSWAVALRGPLKKRAPLEHGEIRFECRNEGGVLPPPLAGEGWGEGISTIENPQEERTLTRRVAPTSPASGRGAPSPRPLDSTQPHSALRLQRRRDFARDIDQRCDQRRHG